MSMKLKPGATPTAVLNGRWFGACMIERCPAGVELCGFRDNFRTEAGAKRYLGWYHRFVNRLSSRPLIGGRRPDYLLLGLEVKVVSVKPWTPA